MKRTALAVAAMLTATLALTACGGSSGGAAAGSATTGPIKIWYSNNAQEVAWGKQAVAAWNAAHADQMVTAEEVPAGKSSEEVIGAAITAGTEPCLIYNTSPASVPQFQKQGGLVDLNSFADGATYIDGRTGDLAKQYQSSDGHYYQLPWKSNPVMIFFNKKLFAKAGISTTKPPLNTYADFIATGKKIVAAKAAKYAIFPAPSSQFFQSWFDFYPLYAAESGGKQLVMDKKSTFNSPAGQAVAGFWRQLYSQKLAGTETYNGDSFADGVAAMAVVGPWAIANYKVQGRLGCRPGPDLHGHDTGQDPYLLRRQECRHVRLLPEPRHRVGVHEVLHEQGPGLAAVDADGPDAAPQGRGNHLRGLLREEPRLQIVRRPGGQNGRGAERGQFGRDLAGLPGFLVRFGDLRQV